MTCETWDPKLSCLKEFIVKTAIIEKRDLRLGKRTFLSLYSKHFNDFVELLMELKHCVRAFFPGSGKHLTCICNRWFVTPCDWSLVPIGLWLKLGRAHSLNGTEEATRGFTFKVLKRIGNVEVRIRHDDFVIEMNCRTNEFCQEGNDSL